MRSWSTTGNAGRLLSLVSGFPLPLACSPPLVDSPRSLANPFGFPLSLPPGGGRAGRERLSGLLSWRRSPPAGSELVWSGRRRGLQAGEARPAARRLGFRKCEMLVFLRQLCFCLPVLASACPCLPLPASACLCLPLPAAACLCLPLLAFACLCLLLPASACRCLPLPASADLCSPLPAQNRSCSCS